LEIAVIVEGRMDKQHFADSFETAPKNETNQEGPESMKEGRNPENQGHAREDDEKAPKHYRLLCKLAPGRMLQTSFYQMLGQVYRP
jgi:hypothetical protein